MTLRNEPRSLFDREILARAAQKLQIVVLTCRERLFGGLAAKRLQVAALQCADVS